nr:Chain D, Synthetic peptide LR [synthetic construct]
LSCQLYQR